MVAPNGPLLSVAEARAARERARSGAQDKGKEVHRWLGERYHQLVESADAVRELASSASRAQGFVARVEDRASAVEAPGAAAAAAPGDNRPEPAGAGDDLAARVVATAPLVWRALDGDDLGAAGGLLARCRAWCGGLDNQSARASLAPYASHLRARVVAGAEAFLYRPPADGCEDDDVAATRRYADALAALAIHGGVSGAPALLDAFWASRSAWIESEVAAVEVAAVEVALRRAAVALRRTVVDADRIFGDGQLLRVAARAMDAEAFAALDESLVADRGLLREASRDWTKRALKATRDLGANLLVAEGCGGAEAAQLAALRDALRASCDGRSPSWRGACGRLFGEVADANPLHVSEAGTRRVLRVAADVFLPDDELDHVADVRRVLVADDADAEVSGDDLARDVDRLCSPWRSALASTFARLVDARLCQGLDAVNADAARLLEAARAALDGAPTALEARLAGMAPNEETDALDVAAWQFQGGGHVHDATAAELSFLGSRLAAFVDAKFKDLARDAALLGAYDDAGAAAVLAALAPRFAETLGLLCGALRRAAAAGSARLRDRVARERRDLKHRLEDPLNQDWDPSSILKDCPGRRFRRAGNLRKTGRTGDDHVRAVRAARSDGALLLVVARACWALQFASVGPLAAATLCGGDGSPEPPGTSDRVVDFDQLAAAFEISDTDGDGVADWRECAEAAGAIMVGAVAARAGGRGPLRNDLEVACPDLSLDELALLSARALDSASRLRVAPGALDGALASARRVALEGWAFGVASPIVDAFAEDLGSFAHAWGDAKDGNLDPSRGSDGRPLPVATQRALREARLERLKAGHRWRERKLDVEADDGGQAFETVRLPCEPSTALQVALFALWGAVTRTLCPGDALATRDGAPLALHAARAALWAVAGPALAAAYDAALADATSDLAPVALLVDAYLLRYALAHRVARTLDGDAAAAAAAAGRAAFEAAAGRVDPIDLELYAPFVKHDATRFYGRSKLYLDVLTGGDDDVDAGAALDGDAPNWAEDDDAPPDDFLDRPTTLLEMAPVCPRFPPLPERAGGDDDDGPGDFDPRKYFADHDIPVPF